MKTPVITALLLAAILTGCASTTPVQQWEARAGANLVADTAACREEARRVNIQSTQGYSDPDYGAAAAMAGRTNSTDLTGDSQTRAFDAVVYVCMTKKGWKPKP